MLSQYEQYQEQDRLVYKGRFSSYGHVSCLVDFSVLASVEGFLIPITDKLPDDVLKSAKKTFINFYDEKKKSRRENP